MQSISATWTNLLISANSSVDIAAFYFTLRDTGLGLTKPSAAQGKQVFIKQLMELEAKGVKLQIAVNDSQTATADLIQNSLLLPFRVQVQRYGRWISSQWREVSSTPNCGSWIRETPLPGQCQHGSLTQSLTVLNRPPLGCNINLKLFDLPSTAEQKKIIISSEQCQVHGDRPSRLYTSQSLLIGQNEPPTGQRIISPTLQVLGWW
ncbi:uncharacterized protein LOC118938731 [Oncorhynchus mykiss]|uniref:uncharacterized protein LOC118938731 n=1 Tax=Oncorhynchus mykiss TaxID=8022 RepID=UPI00187821CF|nr:uncharacterized protein LOC118938731 [Oncorhynchus mykiss]